jgi:FKBP-type peptidyl-prolyl cis-trans isomerase FklB
MNTTIDNRIQTSGFLQERYRRKKSNLNNKYKTISKMKLKNLSLLALAIGIGGASAVAQSNVKLTTHRDSVSYAMGVTLAEEMKKKGVVEVDMDKVMAGLKDQLAGKALLEAAEASQCANAESKKMQEVKKEVNKKEGEAFLAKNKSEKGVVTTASGLQYKITQEGTGASPDGNDKVTVHYTGKLLDGTKFDSSVDRGQPATFGLNQVIKGWTEGLQYLKEGGKAIYYIPYDLAYGPNGSRSIPAMQL